MAAAAVLPNISGMPQSLNIHDRVAVAGRSARILAFDTTPFGGVLVSYDDGTTDLVTADQIRRTYDPPAHAPQIDPSLSAADNFLRAVSR